MTGRSGLIVLFAGAVLYGAAPVSVWACSGCGCKGGPGYRGPSGACVGFEHLLRICGNPPETRCSFENAPGTGANREAVAESVERRSKQRAGQIRQQGLRPLVETGE